MCLRRIASEFWYLFDFCGTAESEIRKVFGSMGYIALWLFRFVSQVNAVFFLLQQCKYGTFSVWCSSFLIQEAMSLYILSVYVHTQRGCVCVFIHLSFYSWAQ